MSNNSPKLPDILDAFHQEHWYLTKLLVLLSIIAITSLGSFSLAQHLLPQGPLVTTTPAPTYSDGVCDADPNQLQSQYVPLLSNTSSSTSSTTSSLAPTKSAIPSTVPTPKSNRKSGTVFEGSAPSVNAEMAFVSSARPQTPAKPTPPPPPPTPTPAPTLTPTPTPTVPDGWYTYGFTDDDTKYAEACAAQFVIDYHTFDYRNPASLETPVSMLSGKAKKLFYLGGTDDTHNIHLHMLSTWRNVIQKNQQSQQATVQQPTISHITPAYSNYIVQVDVGYKLVKQINSQVQSPEVHHDTVILQNTKPSPTLLPNEQHGWEVVDWIDADV